MTDEEIASEKQRINALFDKWCPRVGLSHWDFFHHWHPTMHPSDPNVEMSVRGQWEYLQANVDVYLETTRTMPDWRIERDVVHELCHCLISPMSVDDDEDHRKREEFVASSLSRVLVEAFGEKGPTDA